MYSRFVNSYATNTVMWIVQLPCVLQTSSWLARIPVSSGIKWSYSEDGKQSAPNFGVRPFVLIHL